EDFNKVIALDPNYAKAYYNRGLAYGKKGQHDRAIEDFNKAIALKSDYANAYSGRGLAYSIKGNINKAISDFQKACDLGSESGCENLQEALQKR
ncbi:MAG: tetratricopeptide repeat protein, partial [Deltaproteobacteria bacterium]|nr:tetratricopeptide repeat protein [Deltaproteobacteria bacterium]